MMDHLQYRNTPVEFLRKYISIGRWKKEMQKGSKESMYTVLSVTIPVINSLDYNAQKRIDIYPQWYCNATLVPVGQLLNI